MSKKNHSLLVHGKVFKVILFIVICLLISLQSLFIIYNRREAFFARNYHLQFPSLKMAYDNSQYVKKDVPFIPDEVFEAFAGGVFLQGLNPTHIVHDHPPLGRYLVSLSILIFDNANTVILFAMFFVSLGTFLIAKNIMKSSWWAIVPVALFMNEPLYLNKLVYTPLPEPIQLPFIIFGFYFFIKAFESKQYLRWFIATSIMLGFVISTRFFVTGAGMLAAMIVCFLFLRKEWPKLIPFLISLPLSVIVLILAYFRVVQDSHSILAVFKVQKYILAYHKSAFTTPLSFWDLLLFNRWHTWWGNRAISRDPQWNILWPVSFILALGLIVYKLFRQITLSYGEILLLFWVIIYSLILSVGYSSTRYFLPILPMLYVLAVSFVYRVYNYWKHV